MLTNYIKIAWKVLLRHPFYTFITLFGISLTLTVLMVLTSFLDHLFGSHYPENRRDRTLYMQMVRLQDSSRTSTNSGPASYEFMTKYVLPLKTPEKVGIASMFEFANAYVNGRRIELMFKHTNAEFWDVTDFEFIEGKPYNAQNIANGDNVVVITDKTKRDYFDDEVQSVVGKQIEVDNRFYRVIGVVKGAPVTRPLSAADLFMPYSASNNPSKSEGIGGNYAALVLARSPSDIPAIQTEYNDVIRRIKLPLISNGFKAQYIETTADTYLESWINNFPFAKEGATGIFYGVIALFMILFMSLPAINLVNLNVSRIMERASEIGIRKAFGAPARTLVWQFIVENIFITFLGGAIALLFSSLIIYQINQSGWIAQADLTINVWVFLISILVCLVFGLLSGVMPAFRMAKLPIAEALKS